MLDVTCPWPCSLTLGRVGCYSQRPRKCVLVQYCAQHPQHRRSAAPSYRNILKEGQVNALRELARKLSNRIVSVIYHHLCLATIRCCIKLHLLSIGECKADNTQAASQTRTSRSPCVNTRRTVDKEKCL